MGNVENILISVPKLDTSFIVHGVSSTSGDYVTYMMVGKPMGRTVGFAADKLSREGPNNLLYNGDSVITNGSWMRKEHDGVIA
jgi:hypothetical protein